MNPLKQMKTASPLLWLLAIVLFSCTKETEELRVESPKNYLPAASGRYITYRVDSTIYVNFGAGSVIRSYQEKHVVDSQINDNLNRPAYRVFRFIRDTAATTPWKPSGSHFVTPLENTVEVVENNLRFLKLISPVKEDEVWKGNRFLPFDFYSSFYDFGNDDDISEWEFSYLETDATVTIGGKTYANVATVQQVDEGQNAPVTAPAQFGFRNYSTERYAKGLGLIYQELVMWEYQPPSSPRPGYRGFGVKRSIIDHN